MRRWAIANIDAKICPRVEHSSLPPYAPFCPFPMSKDQSDTELVRAANELRIDLSGVVDRRL